MRILFVDDEPLLLEAIERMLFDRADEWEIESATSGVEGLERLAEEAYDVVISDMRMPGMDGAEFLNRVHAQHPGALRIVLTGQMGDEYALRALPIAHQFLSKPCTPDELTSLIENTQRLQSLVQCDAVRQAVVNVDKLPALPQSFGRLTELMQSDRATAREVARIVEQDPAIAAKLLQLANSAFFARRTRTSDVQTAVVHLGLKTVRGLLLHAALFDAPQSEVALGADELAAIQSRALRVAALASEVMGEVPGRDEAFMGGLLCDVGKLALASASAELWQEVRALCQSEGLEQASAEQRVLGATHAEVGAFLLGVWGLPYAIVEAVAAHHEASRITHPRFDVAAAVHVATALAMGAEPAPEFIERYGCAESLERWRAATRAQRGEE